MLSVFSTPCSSAPQPAFHAAVLRRGADATLEGAPYVQAALSAVFGPIGPLFITVAMVLFAFTTLIGNLYYVDNCLNYIVKKVPAKEFMVLFRIDAMVLIFIGAGMQIGTVWNLADVLMGVMGPDQPAGHHPAQPPRPAGAEGLLRPEEDRPKPGVQGRDCGSQGQNRILELIPTGSQKGWPQPGPACLLCSAPLRRGAPQIIYACWTPPFQSQSAAGQCGGQKVPAVHRQKNSASDRALWTVSTLAAMEIRSLAAFMPTTV